MRRSAALSLLLLPLLPLPAPAVAAPPAAPARPAGTHPSYADRVSAQRSFAQEYVKTHPATLAAPADLDRFLAQLQAAWAKSLGSSASDPALARLDSSTPLTAVLALTARKEPGWARCHLWSHHALPAFYADVDTMRSGPVAERASLIGSMSIVHVLGYPVSECKLSQAEWGRFRAAMDELARVTGTYLDRHVYTPQTHKDLLQLHEYARDQRPVLAVLDALRQDDLARARRELAQGYAQGAHYLWYLDDAGHTLADAHRARGQTDEALSVLDLIARSTRVSDLSAKDLGEWYAAADPRRGPERYARAAARRLPDLVPTGKPVELAGRYVELASGRPLDLASLHGKTVLLDFWATWCGICLAEIPRVNAIAERYGADGKLVVVGISSDALTGQKAPESAVRDVAQKKGMRYPVLYDRPEGSLTERFGVEAWPGRILIGPDGRRMGAPGPISHSLSLDEIEAYLAATWGPRLPPASPLRPSS
jgi:thiol-disulfide isomerase/thioredoxin